MDFCSPWPIFLLLLFACCYRAGDIDEEKPEAHDYLGKGDRMMEGGEPVHLVVENIVPSSSCACEKTDISKVIVVSNSEERPSANVIASNGEGQVPTASGTIVVTRSSNTQGATSGSRTGSGSITGTGGLSSTENAEEQDGTTTVSLVDQTTNTTLTILSQTSPTSSLTPFPEPTDFVLDEVSYEFLNFKSNATSYAMGGLLPITLGGKTWLPGVQYIEAFRCQLNILNSNARILPVSLITYLIQNTDASVALSTQQAFLLMQKNVFMNVGPPYNEQIPPVAYMYAPERLSLVSFDASSIFLANSTTYPSFFRTIPSDNFQARAMAETMRIFGWNFVAALFTTDTYGTSGRSAFLSQSGRQRIKVTCANSIQPGSTSGLGSFADCVASSDASVVLLWMDEENAANALSYLYRNATNTRLTFVASDRWALIDDPEAFNTTVLQRTGFSFPLSFIDGTLAFIPQIGQLGQYRACASQVTPETADYPEFLEVWEDSFRCRYNSSDTLPPCPGDVDERTFECRCTGDEDFSSLPPLVNYVQDTVNILYNALDSLFNPSRCLKFNVSNLCNKAYFTPADYVTSLSLVSINGLTGPIQFNQTQPDRRRANFDILQYRDNGVSEQVGFWNITGPFLAANLLDFKTSPAYPVSVLDPDNTEFGNGFWPKLVAVMSALGILLAILTLIFFTIFYNSRVVRRTNLLWLYTFIIGIILILLSTLLWTFRQSDFTCTVKSLWALLGFSLIVACIIVKVQRIFRVITNRGKVSMILGWQEFFLVLLLALLIPVGLIIGFLFLSGSLPSVTIAQSSVDNTYVFISCSPLSSEGGKQTVRDIFIAVTIFFILLCTICLVLARNLQTAYGEAEYLFLICLDFLLLCAIMVPLYFTVGDRRGSVLQTFLLRSLAILFAMYLTLALLAFPKIIAIMDRRKEKKKREERQRTIGSTAGTAQYTELPSADSGSDSEFTSASTSGKPKFMSLTNTRPSGTDAGSSVLPSSGTASAGPNSSTARRSASGMQSTSK